MGALAACISKNSCTYRYSEESVPVLAKNDSDLRTNKGGSYFPSISGINSYIPECIRMYSYV
jgi:hypothetical protein